MKRDGTPIRVLVADDHPLMREGIAAVIGSQPDMEVAGEAADGEEAVAEYRRLRPDVTLIDLQMPKLNGMETIQAIRAEFPGACLAILTTFRGDARAMQAIKEAGLNPGEDILIVSIDAVPDIFKAMADGDTNATIELNPHLGAPAFDAIKASMDGQDVPKWIKANGPLYLPDTAAEEYKMRSK